MIYTWYMNVLRIVHNQLYYIIIIFNITHHEKLLKQSTINHNTWRLIQEPFRSQRQVENTSIISYSTFSTIAILLLLCVRTTHFNFVVGAFWALAQSVSNSAGLPISDKSFCHFCGSRLDGIHILKKLYHRKMFLLFKYIPDNIYKYIRLWNRVVFMRSIRLCVGTRTFCFK